MTRFNSRQLRTRSAYLFAMMIALASCTKGGPRPGEPPPAPPVRPAPPTPPPAPPPPATAVEAGVRAGPRLDALGVSPYAAGRALAAFRVSCPDLVRRQDASGLTRPGDWTTPCAAAATWPSTDALAFFAAHLEPAVVGEGSAFATGYYEPEIAGSRVRRPGFEVPVYAKPADLLETNPLTGARGRGRLDENGQYVLYYERGEIDAGALAGRGLEIGWAA